MAFLQAIIDGLLIGGVYAVISIGLTLVYGVMGIVNFAQAEFLMVGMFVAWLAWAFLGLDPVLAAPLSFAVAFVIGWFVQGQQTLAPRWFVAGRVEKMSSPFVTPLLVVEQRLNGFEEVVGFRLTPEVTLRLGHRARRGFGRPGYDQQAELSLVWWKRWL